MYVPPDAFHEPNESLILNPLERQSIKYAPDPSALDAFGYKYVLIVLYGSRAVSLITQSEIESVRFTKINRGLNPRYTNGPLLDPLPVYDPKLEYPAMGVQQ